MAAVAGGMESDTDSDNEIVFSSSVKTSKATPNSNSSPKPFPNKKSSIGNSSQHSYPIENERKTFKSTSTSMIPNSVVRNSVMKKRNLNSSNSSNRQRVHKNKSLVFDDLRYAILQGSLESTKELYQSNDIEADTILKSGWTGLMYACSVGHADIAEYLLKNGADSNFHYDMFTPLMAVCISKKQEENLLKCCHLLLEYKANLNVHDRHHTTPLIFATREGHLNIVKLLLERGADVNEADNRGYTPLAWAAFFGHGQIIRVLLENGANKNKTNNMAQLPADIAYENGFPEIASVLQNFQSSDDKKSMESLIASLPEQNNKKILQNSTLAENCDSSKKFTKYGELDLFLMGIDCGNLIPKFKEHHLGFQDLLLMSDEDLEKMGIFQVGLRNKILEASKAVHKKEWQNSSLPNLKQQHYISCPDAVAMVANIAKHLRHISTSVIYVRNQIQAQPRILELSKEGANIHNLMDEIEDSLKNLQSLKDEMRFLKMHLVKIQDKPEYNTGDLIIETASKDNYNKTVMTAVGVTTVSLILAGIWWKYPGLLNSFPPMLLIRIPFSK